MFNFQGTLGERKIAFLGGGCAGFLIHSTDTADHGGERLFVYSFAVMLQWG